MTQSKQNSRIYLWTTLIIILCGLIVYFDSRLNTCYGLFYGFGDLFLLLVLFFLVTIFIIRQVYQIIKYTDNRKIKIWASLVVILATIIAIQGRSTWKEIRLGKSILKASIYPDQLDIGRIELLDSKKYYALYGHIDWSCTFTDDYRKQGDTLILSGHPFEKSDGILADKYIMTDSTLIPMKSINEKMESAEILKIENKNWPQ